MSKRTILNSSLMAIALLAMWMFREPLTSMMRWFSDAETISKAIQRSGIWGPTILFVLFVLQVFIAFIPGQALMVASGYIYGFTGGILITWVSLVTGGQAAFWLARRHGRPFAEKWISSAVLNRWNQSTAGQGIGFFAVSLVLPFFPNDAMCYVAGLGKITSRRFLIANILGRGLASFIAVFVGAYGTKIPLSVWGIGVAAFIVAGLVVYKLIRTPKLQRIADARPSENKAVSILYLSFGSGHKIAAEALADSLRASVMDISVTAEDPFSNLAESLPSFLAGLQAMAILLIPDLYEFFWSRRPDKHNASGNSRILQDLMMKGMTERESDVIITTHVVPCVLLSSLKRSNRLSEAVRIFAVITDYALNRLWPIENIDGYFVPHEELRNALIHRGVKPEIIHVTGIPIKKRLTRQRVNQPCERLRVLMVVGGLKAGGYIMLQKYVMDVLDSLNKLDATRLLMTIVTGNQTQLKQDLEKLAARSPYELEIKGYVNNMDELMANHDILIAKPGGLTIAEAFTSGIPMIVSPPAPGVENANLDFLIRKGVALQGQTAAEVIQSLQFCIENPKMIEEMKLRAGRLGLPNSAKAVAEHIIGEVTIAGKSIRSKTMGIEGFKLVEKQHDLQKTMDAHKKLYQRMTDFIQLLTYSSES